MPKKTPMTEKDFTDKIERLNNKSIALQNELSSLKKRINDNENEKKRIEEEYIISNFRNNNMTAVEFIAHISKTNSCNSQNASEPIIKVPNNNSESHHANGFQIFKEDNNNEV